MLRQNARTKANKVKLNFVGGILNRLFTSYLSNFMIKGFGASSKKFSGAKQLEGETSGKKQKKGNIQVK